MANELDYILTRATSAPKRQKKSSHKHPGVVKEKRKVNPFALQGSAYQYTNTGYREDLKFSCRSAWESNWARILNMYSIKFEFEPKVFTYPLKRGTKAYTPDFFLPETEEWVELKGYMDKKSKLKIKRFKIYWPKEFANLTVIISKYSKDAIAFCADLGVPTVLFYEELSKAFKEQIPAWEGK